MEQSAEINELSSALCKAQGQMKGAIKDSNNPFYKSRYADLSAVWEDIRKPFADNGLSVVQFPGTCVIEETTYVAVITQITHDSGQWIRSKLTMTPTKSDPQGIGSTLTYARRYGLAAMAGVYQIDDDANSASVETPKLITADQVDEINARIQEHEIKAGFMKWLKSALKVNAVEDLQVQSLDIVTKRIDSAIRAQGKGSK